MNAGAAAWHLALVCDARVATSRSFFHLHEVPDGFLPGMATFRLAKFIGLGRARRMALSGRRVDAAEAERIGLVDRICADDALDQTVREALDEFRAMPPDAVELAKRLLNESFAASYEDFVGGFLAAQHRAVQTDTFAAQLGKTNPSKSKD
ncbi:MAG: enoyl-CoA hydratase/isomerase family protein [Deltaproteobacteria bacterium]|nr:enoyl-CoA hydratase/isomerase family protein [Deltaproteobacteria bacterium]